MKFTCERSTLLKEIAIANEIIASKNAISILSNIYIEARDGSLTVKATDMKVNFETKVPVDVIEDGSVTVYGDKFFGILNSIPDGEIEFEQVDSKINIRTAVKKARFQLKSIASDKFPEFAAAGAAFFKIPVRDLKDMIQETIFAVSDDETRETITQVYNEEGYYLDPHSAVGWKGVDKLHAQNKLVFGRFPIGVLSTAHPAKFSECVNPLTGQAPLPNSLADAMNRTVNSQTIPAEVPALLDLLLKEV